MELLTHFPTFDYTGHASSVQRQVGLSDGAGNFSIIEEIKQQTIPIDYFMSIAIGTGPGPPYHIASVTLQNFGPELGGQTELVEGLHAVLYINTVASIQSPTEATVSNLTSVVLPIPINSVTDDYHLYIEYNDGDDSFTGAISVDDATSFQLIGALPMLVSGWHGMAALRVDPKEELFAPSVPALDNAALALLATLHGVIAYSFLRQKTVTA